MGRLVRRWLAAVVLVAAGGPGAALADNGVGAWSALGKWPLVPLHALLLPDGRVLTYGSNGNGKQTGRFIYDVWSPSLGLGPASHWTMPNTTQTDLFCSAQIVLPQSGNVALLGGDNWTGSRTNNLGNNNSLVFSASAGDTLTRGANMHQARWYATATTLPGGDTFIQGGYGGKAGLPAVDNPEIRDATGNFRALTGVNVADIYWWYPRNWVAPDGRIFGFSNRSMYYIDPTGAGSITRLGDMAGDGPSGVTSSEVMFAPGRILRVGGGSINSNVKKPGKRAVSIIDLNSGSPVMTRLPPMPQPLHWANTTVLPNGKVVVTGGSPNNNELVGANYNALLWDPANPRVWTVGARTGASAPHARLYHSIAMLLPDATVLVGGSGANGYRRPSPTENTNAEIYYPPYLFTAAGAFAPRPRILSAPAVLNVGTKFGMTVDNPLGVSRVTLIKTGSVTHSFNMEQRFMELAFVRSGNQLLVTAPANLNLATPGKYLLFVLNAQSVPSIARIVSVANAATPPTLQPFDGLEYIASYPDLIRAFGANAAAGTQHYLTNGQAAGRVPDSFNAHQYLANYADLRAAFGTNLAAARIHYITHGYFEGRTDKAPPTGY